MMKGFGPYKKKEGLGRKYRKRGGKGSHKFCPAHGPEKL